MNTIPYRSDFFFFTSLGAATLCEFGLLNTSIQCFSIHSHLNPNMKLYFSQIHSDIIFPS